MTAAEMTTLTLLPAGVHDTSHRVLDTLRAWHDENHPGSVDYCSEQPCHAITRAVEDGDEDHSMCLPAIHECADECDHECRRCHQDLVCPNQAKHDQQDQQARVERAKRMPDLAAK